MPDKIVVKDLHKEFTKRDGGIHIAIDQLSLGVKPAEFVSVIGPSGCGKTTFIRILAGLIPFDSGEVLIDDKPVTGPGTDRAMVFQTFNLLPWRTVLKNIELGLESTARRITPEERTKRAMEAIELVGLRNFEKFYPFEISGGMQQRTGLARALATDPEVLLMDEPFASVDAQTREFLQDELLRIWAKTRKTIVFITHSIDEAVYLSDRVFVLTPSPARVLNEFEVPLKHPRWEYDAKATEEYGSLRSKIWHILKNSVERERDSRRAKLLQSRMAG
jgi:NitT/TauT family transport system ATP-binding protein